MKINIDYHTIYTFHHFVTMKLSIPAELNKIKIIINDDDYVLTSFAQCQDWYSCYFLEENIVFLLYILELTKQYPQVEIYLEKLLTNVSVEQLNNVTMNHKFLPAQSILQYMDRLDKVSLNSWKIILNYGVNVNIKNSSGNTRLHDILATRSRLLLNVDIINLLINFGAELNSLNNGDRTVLDEILYWAYFFKIFDDNLKTCVLLLLDNGAKNNNYNNKNDAMMEFVESYNCQKIKLAIKK